MSLRVALTHAHCWPEVRRGGERYLHELAGALARRGHEVTIVAGASRRSEGTEDGVRVARLKRSGRGGALEAERRFAKRLGPVLKDGSFDVVHALGPRDAVAAIDHSQARTLYTNLGIPDGPFWRSRPDGDAHQRVVDEIDVYGCLSVHAQNCLQRDFDRTGVVTPGGVRLDRFAPAARSDAPTLLYSGALNEPRKGLATLVDAMAFLDPSVRLRITGSGDPELVLQRAAPGVRDRIDVIGLGSIDELPAIYASSWATVLSATNEAFGLVLVESLACGTPIVAGDHASLPELIEPGAGELAAIEDAQSLADACSRAIALAADGATAQRCRDAAARHDWDASVAPRIESYYLGSGRDPG